MSGQKMNNMTKIIKGTHITIYISRASSKKEASGNQNCIKQLYAYTSLYNRYCDTPAWEFDSWLSEVIYNWTMHMLFSLIITDAPVHIHMNNHQTNRLIKLVF